MRKLLKNPPEYKEQMDYIKLCALHPVLKEYVIHIENEGKKSLKRAKLGKLMGLRKGVSDIFIPIKTSLYSGLWIEFKRKGNYALPAEQKLWLEKMLKQGFQAKVAHGWEEAWKITEEYLNLK